MNRYLFFFLLFLSPFLLSAQYDQVKGEQIIKTASAQYKSYKSAEVQFLYLLKSRINETEIKEDGTFYLKGNNFKLILGDQEIITDSRTVWIYMADVNEVQINHYNSSDLEFDPTRIFTMWEEGYLCGFVEALNMNGEKVDLVELTPYDKSSNYYKVKLLVNQNSRQIKRIQLFEKNSNIITIDILRIVSDVVLSKNFFSFDIDAHPKVEVIDLRE
jgi:outer membrane lipoprotein carrier protein